MESYGQFSDAELTALLKEGDTYAYTEIFKRYTKVLVAHAFRLLGDRDEANDVVQDIFLTLWQKKADLVFTTSLSSYLYTAIRNKIFNRMSHQKIVARYADSIMAFMETGYTVADDKIREQELAVLIEKEIEALPAKMREVFLMHKREELSYKEISAKLDITDKTAKQQVYNAVKILKLKINSFLTLFPFL